MTGVNDLFEVMWSQRAVRDLMKILDYVGQESLTRAEKLYSTLKMECQALREFPYQGRLVPELKDLGVSLYRELVVEGYSVLYRVHENHLLVLTILDSRRDLESILFDLMIDR